MHWKICLFACLVALAQGPASAAQDKDTTDVLIGFAGGITGTNAAVGEDVLNGVRMALADLNHRGAQIDGKRVVWHLDVQDDQADPKQAATAAQHLIDRKVRGVIGHTTSGCTFPASRLYEKAGMPNITASASDPKLGKQNYQYFFRTIGNDDDIATALADHARNGLGAKRIVVVDDRTAYGQGLADAFVARARALGMPIVDREFTSDKATDFSAIITRIKTFKPDLVVFGGLYGVVGPMVRQSGALGLDVPVMGGDSICTQAMGRLAGPAVDRVICGSGGQSIEQMPGGVAWKQRYDKLYGPDAYQGFSPFAYDAMMVMASAMIKAQSADPKRYAPLIAGIGHDGVSRRDIRFDSGGNLHGGLVTLYRFDHGNKKVLATPSAD